jgi:hypothetical protein
MHCCFIIVSVLITSASAAPEKINLETLNNYSEFLNFGEKKLKLKKESLENSIIKSKVDVLGEVFKKNIDSFKNFGKLEVIFLIDGSSSVGESNFRSELKFVKKLLSDVTIDYNHTRVAIVTFSSSAVSLIVFLVLENRWFEIQSIFRSSTLMKSANHEKKTTNVFS